MAVSDMTKAVVGSPTAIETLLGSRLPDWQALLAAANQASSSTPPMAILDWAEASTLRSNRSVRQGDNCDLWLAEGVFCLSRHPGLADRLFGWLFRLLAQLFAPVLHLRQRFDAFLVHLSARLGAAFAIFGIPLALIGFVVDAAGLVMALLRAVPGLLFSPLALVQEIVALPFRLVTALLSRFLRTFLLAWLGPWLNSSAGIETLLQRHPWLRGVILGFLRSDRPPHPVLIPLTNLSQVMHVTRVGLTGKKHYVVLVEGDPIVKGLRAWLSLRVKELVLPFYWERTVHMLCLSTADREEQLRTIGQATRRPVSEWS